MNNTSVPLDGIRSPDPTPEKSEPPADPIKTSRMKHLLLFFFGIPYVLYALWSTALLVLLPPPSGGLQTLTSVGTFVALIGILFFLLVGTFAILRIRSKLHISDRQRMIALIKTVGVLLPGLILSIAIPFAITREPALGIGISEPTTQEEFVAPLAVTFNLDHALSVLALRGLTPVKFEWDFEGDGTKNDETVVPEATAIYDRQGVYTIVVRITLNDGTQRRITRSLSIPTAVFSIAPFQPIVDEPVRFSVEHLVLDPKEVKEVQWDFSGDGEVDEVTTSPAIIHTFIRTGPVTVVANMLLTNQSQRRLERVLNIRDPEPLPFPVTFKSEPENLLSPSPFGAIFWVETDEPLREVLWDFGDGEEATGERVGHTFDKVGVYRVSAEARSESGSIAKTATIVRVADLLNLPDLRFDGSPAVQNNRIIAEVPVTLSLTPHTTQPLVDFQWEAPNATLVQSTNGTLQATYRREGTYTVSLLASDPEGRAARIPIVLEVRPPSSEVAIKMTPEGGTAPLVVRFDASETAIPGKTITGFEWQFSNEKGALPQKRGAQVEYRFEDAGTYTIRLRALTTTGETFDGQKTIVVRAPILDACLQASRTSGPAPLGVQFTMSCSTGTPATILWNFGDETESDTENPIHVFDSPGEYTVTLTLRDENGTLSTDTLTITVE